jgi:hypothetical protein
VKCGCVHSFGVICGAFAGMALALLLAEGRCLDAGGRVSDAAWQCEAASGAVSSLWQFATPGILALAALLAVAVYWAASALGRRLILR